MEFFGTEFPAALHPQCVSRLKSNFFFRNFRRQKIAAVTATMLNAEISCQSMNGTYAERIRTQPAFESFAKFLKMKFLRESRRVPGVNSENRAHRIPNVSIRLKIRVHSRSSVA
jgi:hypothetical protein